jgi:hypothetical protein
MLPPSDDLMKEEYILPEHLGLETLVFRLPCGCQGRQGGALLQHGFVWPRRGCALLGSL